MALFNINDFTHGELTPKMLGKSNLEIYKKSAQQLRNIIIDSNGNAKRRFGFLYKDDFGTITNNEIMFVEYIFNDDTVYLLVFVDLSIKVYKDGVFKVSITSPWPGSLLTNLELKISQTENQMTIVHPDYEPRELSRGGDDVTWTLSAKIFKNFPGYDYKQNYDNFSFKLSIVTIGQSKHLTCTHDSFDASYIGGYFQAYGQDLSDRLGMAKITSISSTKIAVVEIIAPFSTQLTNNVSGKNVYLAEPAFSTARGWPSSVSYYEGRRWFGGSKSLPHTVFGSVVDDFRNFEIGTGLDSDAVQETIGGHKIGVIKHILGDRSLQIFTSRAEYTVGQAENRAITPQTFAIKQQSSNGISIPRPIVLDNQTFYVKKGGKGVMNYVFDNDSQSYNSEEISLVSSHLINNPIDIATLKGSEIDNSAFMFVINSDGTLAIYQSVIAESISAFTLSETTNTSDGKFIRCVEIDNEVYFAVQRTINGIVKTYLEKLSFDVKTDSTIQQDFGSPTSIITNLNHLEQQVVKVKGDGYLLEDKTVVNGRITLDTPRTIVDVGLEYNPTLTPNPIAFEGQLGNTMYKKKKILKVFIDYYESLGIYVDDLLIPGLEFGDGVLDQVPELKTGVYRYEFLLKGWDDRNMITISQKDPLDMTIRGIGFEVTD